MRPSVITCYVYFRYGVVTSLSQSQNSSCCHRSSVVESPALRASGDICRRRRAHSITSLVFRKSTFSAQTMVKTERHVEQQHQNRATRDKYLSLCSRSRNHSTFTASALMLNTLPPLAPTSRWAATNRTALVSCVARFVSKTRHEHLLDSAGQAARYETYD